MSSSDLTGPELFELLTRKVAPTKRKKTADSGFAPNPAPNQTDWLNQSGWVDSALVLQSTNYTCINCGESHTVANPYVLLKRTHPKYGSHYKSLVQLPTLLSDALPRVVETNRVRTPVCQTCFPSASSEALIQPPTLPLANSK